LRDDQNISTESGVYATEDTITDSFPLMVILSTLLVTVVFHSFVYPYAVKMARFFADSF